MFVPKERTIINGFPNKMITKIEIEKIKLECHIKGVEVGMKGNGPINIIGPYKSTIYC